MNKADINNNVFEIIKQTKVYQGKGLKSINKPVLILMALYFVMKGKERLNEYVVYEQFLSDLLGNNGLILSYPFVRLESDGFWDIISDFTLLKNSSGDVSRKILLKGVKAGFSLDVYSALIADRKKTYRLSLWFLKNYILPANKSVYDSFYSLFFDNDNFIFDDTKVIDVSDDAVLMSNEGEPTSKWWMRKGLDIIDGFPDAFVKDNLRKSRIEFIAGTNRLKTIKSWLLAAEIIQKKKSNANKFELSYLGRCIRNIDPEMENASTWWAIHIHLCLSSNSLPYFDVIKVLVNNYGSWLDRKNIINALFYDDSVYKKKNYKQSTLESVSGGVLKMFEGDKPLAEMGILEKSQISGTQNYRIGDVNCSDSVFIYAIQLFKSRFFPTRSSLDFSELINIGLNSCLCMSSDEFRKKLRKIGHNDLGSGIRFNEVANLQTVDFSSINISAEDALYNLLKDVDVLWI
ncbi:DUF4007 family protein [Ectothiorhodospiraceae bacterium BW-2]|nr:DUF4007 family protein [Ectothiorhodospiraceae bacterium BW-2]